MISKDNFNTISKINGKHYTEIAKDLDKRDFELYIGSAIDIKDITKILEERGILFYTTPSFTY